MNKNSVLISVSITVQCYSVPGGETSIFLNEKLNEFTEAEDILPKEYRVYLYIKIKDFWMHILKQILKNNKYISSYDFAWIESSIFKSI